MRVVCHGDVVGEWFLTYEMHRLSEYTVWKWLNPQARLFIILRVKNEYIRPPSAAERVKGLAKKCGVFMKRVFR